MLAALVASLLLHLIVVVQPGWEGRQPAAEGPADLLVARLVRTPAAPVPAARQPQPARPAQPPPRPEPAVRMPAAPQAQAAAAPAEAAPVEATPYEAAPVEPVAAQETTPPAPTDAAEAYGPGASAPAAAELPAEGWMRFGVTRGEGGLIVGQATHSWRRDENGYAIEAVTETIGLAALIRPITFRQTSAGAVAASGLVPRQYQAERNGQVTETARFDWEDGRVTLTSKGEQEQAQLVPGSQDVLSQLYQAGLGRREDGRLEMAIATGKSYKLYVFRTLGEETLETRLGPLRTLHLRAGGEPGEQVTEVWIALEHRNLPVRIRHRDRKGEIYDQTVEELRYEGMDRPS
ncbi:MAG: DUF3108 domain-containing protein [Pseudomonadota bacterium]